MSRTIADSLAGSFTWDEMMRCPNCSQTLPGHMRNPDEANDMQSKQHAALMPEYAGVGGEICDHCGQHVPEYMRHAMNGPPVRGMLALGVTGRQGVYNR